MINPLCVAQEDEFNTLLRRAVDLEELVGGRDGADSDEDDEQIRPGNAVHVVDDGGFDSFVQYPKALFDIMKQQVEWQEAGGEGQDEQLVEDTGATVYVPLSEVKSLENRWCTAMRSCKGGGALIQAPIDCGSLLDGVSQSTPSPLEATVGSSLDETAEKSNKIAKSKKASKDRRAKKRAREREKHRDIRGDVRRHLVMAAGAIATDLSTESLPVAQGGSQALNYKAKPKLPKLTLEALKKGGYRYVEWNGEFLFPDPC